MLFKSFVWSKSVPPSQPLLGGTSTLCFSLPGFVCSPLRVYAVCLGLWHASQGSHCFFLKGVQGFLTSFRATWSPHPQLGCTGLTQTALIYGRNGTQPPTAPSLPFPPPTSHSSPFTSHPHFLPPPHPPNPAPLLILLALMVPGQKPW